MITEQKKKKVLTGVVVSDAMNKTVVVEVLRYVKHPKYKKYQKISKRYQAHDADEAYSVGERVRIEECRPLSRHKHFTVIGRV